MWALKCALRQGCALVSYFVSWERAASHVILSHLRRLEASLEKLAGKRNIENQWPVGEENSS